MKKLLTTPPVKKIDLHFPTGLEVTARNLKGVTIKDALDAIYKQFKKKVGQALSPILESCPRFHLFAFTHAAITVKLTWGLGHVRPMMNWKTPSWRDSNGTRKSPGPDSSSIRRRRARRTPGKRRTRKEKSEPIRSDRHNAPRASRSLEQAVVWKHNPRLCGEAMNT